MLFALIAVCSIPAQDCRIAEDTTGPHATMAECRSRLAEMRAAAPALALEAGAGPWQLLEVCDRLARVRAVIPGAFEGHADGVAL